MDMIAAEAAAAAAVATAKEIAVRIGQLDAQQKDLEKREVRAHVSQDVVDGRS